jgi:hypothetical protein
VGALFFTVLMIAGFSVLSLALDAQTDIVTTQRIISDIEIKKQQEQFGIIVSTDLDDFLNVSVKNMGQNPVEISSIWITNKTLSNEPVKRFDVNYDDAFIPSGFTLNVVENQILQMIPATYDIKVISSFGTIKTTELDMTGGGTSGLRAEMITDPPDPVIGKNVTTAMIVTNIGDVPITNVSPNVLSTSTSGTGTITTSPPVPSGVATLNTGASVMFTWDSQVTGDSGDVLSFLSSATGDGPVISNTVSDTSLLRLAGEGGGNNDPDILTDELLARPQLFFIIPSSQGESGDTEALWGINVVNPVDAPMEVSKLVITAFAPGANSADKLFNRVGGNCDFNPIAPVLGPDSNWSCPSNNAIMWKSTIPESIPANSTKSFLTKIDPGSPSGNDGLESIIVQGSVFTTLGSFGKSGYQTTMSESTASVVNVFLATDLVGDPRVSSKIEASRINIVPNNLETFHAVFADMDSATTEIESNAKFIINVPKEWTDVDVTAWNGFPVKPSIQQFGDTSHQIVGTTNVRFGDTTSADSVRTITFNARAPDVAADELYVMYILAQGTTTHATPFTIGPTAEIVLQVNNG